MLLRVLRTSFTYIHMGLPIYIYIYVCNIYITYGASQVTQWYLSANAERIRDTSSIPRSGRFPWSKKWQLIPLLLTGKFHGWRSLAGYSPWGHSQTQLKTEYIYYTHTHTHMCIHTYTHMHIQVCVCVCLCVCLQV